MTPRRHLCVAPVAKMCGVNAIAACCAADRCIIQDLRGNSGAIYMLHSILRLAYRFYLRSGSIRELLAWL